MITLLLPVRVISRPHKFLRIDHREVDHCMTNEQAHESDDLDQDVALLSAC